MIDNDGIEKDLKELTGISISQLRALALSRPLGDSNTRTQSNAPQSPIAPPPPPEIVITDQTLKAQPIEMGDRHSPPVFGGAENGASMHTLIIVENGIAYYAQAPLTIGAAVT